MEIPPDEKTFHEVPMDTAVVNDAPPPYMPSNQPLHGAPPPQMAQQMPPPGQPPTTVYVMQQGVPQPQPGTTVIVLEQGVKIAPSFAPYTEYCPHCRVYVTTHRDYVWGFCAWLYFFLGLLVFCPLIFCICCDSSKDVKHFCPNCHRLLAYKKR